MRRRKDSTLAIVASNIIHEANENAARFGHTVAWSVSACEDGYVYIHFTCVDCSKAWRRVCGHVSVGGAVSLVTERDTRTDDTHGADAIAIPTGGGIDDDETQTS